MKVSKKWLQKFFEQELPRTETLTDAIMFHAFEVEGVDAVGNDEVLDLKVLQRGHDCLSHRGVAKEISAIIKIPLVHDPFNAKPDLSKNTDAVTIIVDTPLCKRYIAGYIKGVTVGPSPQWLVDRLEAVGQRSINNVVDATNFVMFNTGQPMHAFDAGKLQQKDGKYSIAIRYARSSEQLHALDGIQYELTSSMLVIADQNNNEPIGVAGVKGGMPAAITEKTNDIILESANFNAGSVRKTAQALKLRTEASVRFEQDISPELAAYGMQSVVELIQKLAGGELAGFADAYPNPVQPWHVLVSVQNVNQVLGIILTGADIADVFQRLQFPYKEEGDVFTVVVPFERLDLTMSEDLIEEVGRIVGYDKIPALPLPPAKIAPKINQNFYRAEYTRAFLIARGFSEVYTNVFSESGERIVLNKVDGVRPYLRNALKKGLQDTLEKNIRSKELLGLSQIKIFEIGTVWRDGKELIEVTIEVEKVKGQKTQEEYKQELDVALASLPENPTHYEPIPLSTATRYQPFSKYPYIVRDIALWTPAGTNAEEVLEMIKTQAGELCVKIYLFDTFTKEGRVSLAFRLIFQSFERTLTEEEVNKIMAELSGILGDKGFEIR